MKLSEFLQDLLLKGSVIVDNKVSEFEKDDLEQTVNLLKSYYMEDKLEMPYNAPEFSATAALWSCKYLYYAMQSSLLRNVEEETVNELLKNYPEKISPEAIYSADLCFRYLPKLFDFIKGLAPDDILVKCLEKITVDWPFSSVGIELNSEINLDNLAIILENKSLASAYIDRIIRFNDLKRVSNEKIKELIKEALGNYSDILWDNFLDLNFENNQSIKS